MVYLHTFTWVTKLIKWWAQKSGFLSIQFPCEPTNSYAVILGLTPKLISILFSVQHLFLTFPRIVFMLGFLVFVFFLLAGYCLFHFYLALVNQTSNEWFKAKGHNCQHCHPYSGHKCRTSYNPFRGFYHRGILKNIGEIFWPLRPVQKKEN